MMFDSRTHRGARTHRDDTRRNCAVPRGRRLINRTNALRPKSARVSLTLKRRRGGSLSRCLWKTWCLRMLCKLGVCPSCLVKSLGSIGPVQVEHLETVLLNGRITFRSCWWAKHREIQIGLPRFHCTERCFKLISPSLVFK